MKKRLMSLFLVMVMLFTMMPTAFAEEGPVDPEYTYSVTFKLNNGDADIVLTKTSKDVTHIFALPATPTKACHKFDCWTNANGNGIYGSLQLDSENPTTTLYAKWKQEHVDVGSDNTNGYCDCGEECLHELTNGYCEVPGCTHPETCCPKAPEYTYTVTFDVNGGENGPEDWTLTSKDASVLCPPPAKEPQKEGYTFARWNNRADGNGVVSLYSNMAGLTMNSSNPTAKFYAIYTPNSYTVTFHNGAETVVQDFVYDVEQALTANAFTKTGHSFIGWATEENGNVVYTDKKVIKNLIAENNGNFDLYAVWKKNVTVEITNVGIENRPYFVGDTFTVTAEATGTDKEINLVCSDENFKLIDAEDGVFTFKVVKANKAYAQLTFTAAVEGVEDTASAGINLRNKVVVKLTDNGAEIGADNIASITLQHKYVADRTVAFTGDNGEFTHGDWAVASDDYDSILVVLKDGRQVKLTKTDGGQELINAIRAAEENPIEVAYNFPGYSIGGKLFINGKAQMKADGTSQYIKYLSGTYGKEIKYDQLKAWAVEMADKLDAANDPVKFDVAIYKDGGTWKNVEKNFGEAGKLQNWVWVDVTTSYEVTFLNDGETFDTQTVKYNNSATKPTAEPEKVGYTFKGWADAEGNAYDFTAPVTKSMTLVAEFEPITYAVEFDKNGGYGTMPDQCFTYDEVQKLTANAFKKNGYVFAGWKDADGKTYTDEQEVKNLTAVDGATVTLTAQWENADITIKVDPNGGVFADGSADPITATVKYMGKYVLPEITKEGYHIDSWYTRDADGNKLMACNDDTDYLFIGDWNGLTIYPEWEANTYTVTFNADGGEVSPAEKEVTFDATYGELPVPTKTGYTFVGWKLDGADVTAETIVKTAADHSLVAEFEKIIYNITVQQNEGGKVEVQPTATYGDKVSVTVTPDKGYQLKSLVRKELSANGYTISYPIATDCFTMPAADVTIVAEFEKIIYNITVEEPENGTIAVTVNGVEAETATIGDKVVVTVTPDEHYKVGLAKWSYPNHSNLNYGSFSFIMPADDVTVFARFDPIMYSITVEQPEHGYIKVTLDGEEVTSAQSGKEIKVEYTADEGYKVAYRRMTIGNKTELSYKDFTLTMSADVKFAATVSPIKYTVKFDANDGEGTMEDQSFTYDEAQNLTGNAFAKTGYHFIGWATEKDGAVVYTDEQSIENLTSEDNAIVTLYAVWEANTYSLVYNGNGGLLTNGKDKTSSNVKYDAEITFKNADTFTRTGYTFVEWNTAADGSGDSYDPEEKGVKNLADEEGEKVDLYAIWAPITYTVEFDGNGATAGEMADQSFNYDETAKALTKNAFSKVGYHFIGWKDANGKTYTDEQEVQNLTAENNGVVALTAQWEINEYTVTFDSKGGSEVDGQTVEHGQKATEPAVPTRSGYRFAGWMLNGKVYDFETAVTSDIELVADWNRKSSSNSSSYDVIIEKTKNGDVESSRKTASKGDTITITVDPDKGYEVDDITVAKKNGDEIKVTKKSATKYTFTMPAADVYVDVDFEKEAAWPFTDVDKDDACYDAVKFMYENGLMAGIGDGTLFAPDMDLSRAMTARIFHTLEGNTAAAASDFTDVARNFWYTDAIDWAAAIDVISGYGDGTFGPNNSVTKEQLAMMLYKYAQSKGYDVSMSAKLEQVDVSFWAVDAVEWAAEIGVLAENGVGYVVATEAASRADVAEAFMAFLKYYA